MTIRGQWNLTQDGIAGPVRSNACNILIGNLALVAGTADQPLSALGKNVPLGSLAFVSRETWGDAAVGDLRGEVIDDGGGDRVLRISSTEVTDTGSINWMLVLP